MLMIVVPLSAPRMCRRQKSDREPLTQTSQEKPRGADPKPSPDLRWTRDWMVVTEGVLVNLTLQLTRREKHISNLRQNMPVLPDSLECAALRADMEGNRLNSQF